MVADKKTMAADTKTMATDKKTVNLFLSPRGLYYFVAVIAMQPVCSRFSACVSALLGVMTVVLGSHS